MFGHQVMQVGMSIAVCAAVLGAAWFVFNPAPIPSATSMVGGLAGMWIARRRSVRVAIIGTMIGLLVGAAIHAWSHIAEGRAEPRSEFIVHVMLDALLSLAIGAIGVAGALAVSCWGETKPAAAPGSDAIGEER